MIRIDMTLTDIDVKTFTPELTSIHLDKDHAIPTIPANYDIADALQFIFGGIIEDIAQVMQDYVDGSEDAVNLVEGLREGIHNRNMCLICVKRDLRGIDGWHCYE